MKNSGQKYSLDHEYIYIGSWPWGASTFWQAVETFWVQVEVRLVLPVTKNKEGGPLNYKPPWYLGHIENFIWMLLQLKNEATPVIADQKAGSGEIPSPNLSCRSTGQLVHDLDSTGTNAFAGK